MKGRDMKRPSASRRTFLQSGIALAASSALPGFRVMRSAHAATGVPRTLIVIHLAGGNDTLNTVVPYTNPDYYAARKLLAVPAAQVLPLNAQQGLHPALTGIKALYDASKVAIVNGVGYPTFDYSHFQAMQIYWTADPTQLTTTGWLGRSLDAAVAGASAPDILTGAAIGSGSPSLIGRSFASVVLPNRASRFKLPATDDLQAVALSRILQQPTLTTTSAFDAIVRNNRTAVGALDTVSQAGRLTAPVIYPTETFAQSLQFAAQLLRADAQIQVITMQQGSYDMHQNQSVRQAADLSELSAGVTTFMGDLQATGISNRVLILLWSEFSRRVLPNASAGTDHGSAQALFLIGDGVKGGVYGAPPSLKPETLIDKGNLPMAVDFRQVYATVLSGWLGLSPAPLLGADWGALPLLL